MSKEIVEQPSSVNEAKSEAGLAASAGSGFASLLRESREYADKLKSKIA